MDWKTIASYMFFFSVVAICITSVINNIIFYINKPKGK